MVMSTMGQARELVNKDLRPLDYKNLTIRQRFGKVVLFLANRGFSRVERRSVEYYCICDRGKTKLLLRKIGISGIHFNRRGKISREERNRLIKVFWTKKDKLSLQEIADCFLITRERVNQIARKLGLTTNPKESATLLVRQWAKGFTTQSGQRHFSKVMRQAARERRFWARAASSGKRGRLRKLRLQPVMESLGLAEVLDSFGGLITRSYEQRVLYPYAWGELRRLSIVSETDRIGVVLLYGLGEDPTTYLRREYVDKGRSPERIITVINRRAVSRGLVTAGCTVALFMFLKKKNIHRKM